MKVTVHGKTYEVVAGWEKVSNGNEMCIAKKPNGEKQYMIIAYGNDIFSVMGM